ncbi:antiterminator Q family protein [Yersinia enterocolitica]|uniref:antiterminator Q family protein n=1 Tax=Yersinia enterocolitica TaxID=630 RepID=UPI00398C9838
MRDIQLVLERWGGWAASDNNGVDYSPIAAGFKGLLPSSSGSRLSCNDDDGLIVDSCVARLKQLRPDEYTLLVEYYVFNQSKRSIARYLKKDEKLIRISIQLAEGFIEGCLSNLDFRF